MSLNQDDEPVQPGGLVLRVSISSVATAPVADASQQRWLSKPWQPRQYTAIKTASVTAYNSNMLHGAEESYICQQQWTGRQNWLQCYFIH